MSIPHHKLERTTVAGVQGSRELKQIIRNPLLESETIIIRPNWLTTDVRQKPYA